MLSKLRCIITVIVLAWMNPSLALGFIEPPSKVVHIARELAYPDFPRAADILAIIRIESGFNPKAKNKMSNGIMQVNYGPFDIRSNMIKGVILLRQYYEMTHSVIGAVKSYNIGIGNYFNGLLTKSAEDYWSKFTSQLHSYEEYERTHKKTISLSMICLGCVSTATIFRNKFICRRRDFLKENYLENY